MAKNSLPAGAEEHAVKILDRVWTLSRKRKAAKSQRENCFTERDSIDAEIDEMGEPHSPESGELAAKWREVCKKIEKLKVDIDFFSDEIDRAIQDGEQGKFEFLDDAIKPDATLYSKLKPKKQEESKKDDRPVGVPDDKHQLKITHAQQPEGVDEHLKAAVQELGLSDRDTDRLIAAKLGTVGHLASLLDAAGGTLGPLQDKLNCGQEIAARIAKAVSSFRGKHRKAMLEKERQEAGL